MSLAYTFTMLDRKRGLRPLDTRTSWCGFLSTLVRRDPLRVFPHLDDNRIAIRPNGGTMFEKRAVRSDPRQVPIVVRAPEAKDVRVTGDFTLWAKRGIRLIHDGIGHWRTVLPLQPGRYQYRLLIDGDWRDHEAATERVANPFGSENCILKVL